MTYSSVRGPGLSLGGPRGPRGLKGDKPRQEVSEDGLLIRWEQPDGTWGPWFDVGLAAREEAARASDAADRASQSASEGAISAGQALGARNQAVAAEGRAQNLVDAATAAYVGFEPGTFYDLGRVTDALQLFASDLGRVTDPS